MPIPDLDFFADFITSSLNSGCRRVCIPVRLLGVDSTCLFDDSNEVGEALATKTCSVLDTHSAGLLEFIRGQPD